MNIRIIIYILNEFTDYFSEYNFGMLYANNFEIHAERKRLLDQFSGAFI